jgi:TonB-dependent SusC/RagA subfamily outer membrane receptor
MTASASHALLPVGLVVGLVAACTHSSGTRPTSPPSSPTVTSEDIERNPGQPIEKVLQGRFAGVEVSRTSDGGIAVRIRGATSLHASTQPLYVVDGMSIEPGPNGSLSGINPYDIESIQVLKDPAETAMYGMRGANGVIIIKTKRPGR